MITASVLTSTGFLLSVAALAMVFTLFAAAQFIQARDHGSSAAQQTAKQVLIAAFVVDFIAATYLVIAAFSVF